MALNKKIASKCRLYASVCNDKQRLNNDKRRCECKELVGKGICANYLFGILVYVNVINHVIQDNNQVIQILNVV